MKVTKKILSGIAVIGLTAIGFTNADFNSTGYYFYSDTNTTATAFGNTYYVGEKGSFNTNHVNVVNNVFYWNFGYDNLVKTVLAWKNGKLYFMGGAYNDIKTQGYIEKFCVKEKNTRTDYLHADNCVYDTSLETIIQGNPEFTEYAFMVNGSNTPTWGYGNTPLEFCFSDGNLDYCISCSAYYQNTTNEGTGPCASGLTGTLNITGTNFDTLLNYTRDSSPLAGGGGNSSGTGETGTGTQKYCPPIQYEINMYGYKYNTGLCYSNTEEISGGQVTTVTPISIFDAFPTYQAYAQAYNLVTNNCHTSTVNTVEQCQTALQTIGKKPSQILLKLINSNIQEGVSLSKIYQYCHLQLDYTEEEKWNKSTCDIKNEGTYYASGVNQNSESNPNPLQGMTDQLQDSTDIVIPEDGTIFDSILPDGVLSWKDVIFDFNFWGNLTALISKIIILFKIRPIQTGILPPVITSLLLLIILFKIYKK